MSKTLSTLGKVWRITKTLFSGSLVPWLVPACIQKVILSWKTISLRIMKKTKQIDNLILPFDTQI